MSPKISVERPQFHPPARAVERNAGPTLFPDERLWVLGDEFQQLDVFPGASTILASQHFSFSAFSFSILRRRLTLIVADRRSDGFLAFRQQVLNEGFSKMALSKGIVLVLDYRHLPLRYRDRPLRLR